MIENISKSNGETMKSKKSMIKSMIIKPDNLTKIMSIILYDPLCYDQATGIGG